MWNDSDLNRDDFFIFDSVESLLASVSRELASGDTVLIMSNGGFESLQNRLIEQLQNNSSLLSIVNSKN